MKEYIITVSAAAVVAAVCDILTPDEWGKYIKIMVGFLILAVIVSPVAKFRDAGILPEGEETEISDIPLKDSVCEGLRQGIESDIEQRLRGEYELEAKAQAEISTDSEHRITGVDKIIITTWKNPDGMAERIKEIYGCDKVEIRFE